MTTTATKTTPELELFYAELLQDPMLQEQLKAAANPAHLSELVVELAKGKGYSLTQEEVSAAMAIEAALGEESLTGNFYAKDSGSCGGTPFCS